MPGKRRQRFGLRLDGPRRLSDARLARTSSRRKPCKSQFHRRLGAEMVQGADLSPEHKAALAALFKAAFELGYRQGFKGASSTENDAVIRATLREAIEIILNSPDEPMEGSTAADNLRDPDDAEKLDKLSYLVK
jgi:hypothetical protein